MDDLIQLENVGLAGHKLVALVHDRNHDVWWVALWRGECVRFTAYTPGMVKTRWHFGFKSRSRANSVAYDHVNNLLITAHHEFDYISTVQPCRKPNAVSGKKPLLEEFDLQKRYPKRYLIAVDHVNDRLVLGGAQCIDIISRSSMEHHVSVIGCDFGYNNISCIAFDAYQNRVVVAARFNHPLLSFCAKTGTLVNTAADKQYAMHECMCVDNQGRVLTIGLEPYESILYAYTPDLQKIVATKKLPWSRRHHRCLIGFDSLRGTIGLMIAIDQRRCLYQIPANTWLPRTYEWAPATHGYAPAHMRRVVQTIANIRALAPETPLALMPNELLFLIFEHL